MDLVGNLLQAESNQTDNQRIFTTGYAGGGREITDLPGLLTALDAVLIDIRFRPSDTPLKWSRQYLKLLLQRKYLHVSHLGNRTYLQKGRISIQNLELGIRIIRELRVNVLLLCECAEAKDCHRLVISQKLKEQGSEVQEIADWKRIISKHAK